MTDHDKALTEPPAAREGYVLVPKEPTEAMKRDGAQEFAMTHQRVQTAEHCAHDIYRAMIAAAPPSEPPAAPYAQYAELVEEARYYLKADAEKDVLQSLVGNLADAIASLLARVGELDAALAEIGCGYYADRDAPWRLDRVVNIARAVRNRLPWEPIAELKVTEEEKARGEGLVARAEAAEKALRKYGQHKVSCDRFHWGKPCTCGLDAALAQPRDKEKSDG